MNNRKMFTTISDRDDHKHIINLQNINDIEFKEVDKSYQISEVDEYYVQINLNNERSLKVTLDEYTEKLKSLLEGLDGKFADWK